MRIFTKWQQKLFYILGMAALLCLMLTNAMSAKAYVAKGTEPNSFTQAVTPPDAVGSRVNVLDAFNLPGTYQGTGAAANFAYISNTRDNVAVLYNGTRVGQKSALWYNQKLDLNQPFEFEAYVYLSNTGASSTGVGDGLAFVLQNDPQGTEAMGGFTSSGNIGSMGIYPAARGTVNMIYNALTVELDTNYNSGSYGLDYSTYAPSGQTNRGLTIDSTHLGWPHAAMSTTATRGNRWSSSNTARPINETITDFMHRSPVQVATRTEGNAWFGRWVKLNVRWMPNNTSGTYTADDTGSLSYTWGPIYNANFEGDPLYEYNTQTWSDINIDKTFGSEFNSGGAFGLGNREVYWGFTGSNGTGQTPAGVMITKLPNEPDIVVDRKVRNVSTSGSFDTFAVAKPGEILEYTVTVENSNINKKKIPLTNTKIKEDLATVNYVNGSFKYSSTHTGFTTPTISTANEEFTFTDSVNSFKVGEKFSYTYQVQVGQDTTEFINDVEVSSTYSTAFNAGETNVTVFPDGINLAKSASDSNPKVNDSIDISIDLSAQTGISVLDTIKDSIPIGFELVAGSTELIVYEGHDKNTIKGSETLSDDLWTGTSTSGYTLDFKVDDDLNNSSLKELFGGSIRNNLISLTYKIKPTTFLKGEKDISLGVASTNSTNKVNGIRGTISYPATSNGSSLTIKTDLTFNFLDDQGQPLNNDFIQSANSNFNGINPVILYLNTDDGYDYSTIISEISGNLLNNQNLALFKVNKNLISGSLTDISGTAVKDGTVIDLYYGSKAILTVEFVDETNQVMSGHTITIGENQTIPADIFIGDVINLKDPAYTGVQEKVQELKNAGYESITPPNNEAAIQLNSAAVTVQYKVKGQLIISSYPKEINFGSLIYNGSAQRVENPSLSDRLTITDTRAGLKYGYVVKATLTKEMENDEGSILGDAVRYVKGLSNNPTDEVVLTEQAQEVFRQQDSGTGIFALSDTWSTTTERTGIILLADPSNARLADDAPPNTQITDVGTFTGEITWSIEAIP
ncbi:hypothetical protein ACYSNU_00475 [Enterococcus sp. LJL120]